MIFSGILCASAFILTAQKLSPKTLKRLLGYHFWTDIGCTIGFSVLGLASGTFSGLITGAVSGIIVSLCLTVARNILGYSVFVDGAWVDKPGKWTIEYVVQSSVSNFNTYRERLVSGVKTGLAAC